MNSAHLRRLMIVALLLMTGCAPANRRPDDQSRFNVLFISADDLNCDLGAYGHKVVKSPNIDRLARSATRFDRAYCQFPLCSPSRVSLMTGLRPDTTRIYDLQTDFRETIRESQTLAEMFRLNGYFTARVGKVFHYGVPGEIGTPGLDDPLSWDMTVNPFGRDRKEHHLLTNYTPDRGLGSAMAFQAAEGADTEQTDGIAASEAVRFLESNRDRPFFLAVGFFRPHTPFVAPKKYFDLYPIDKLSLPNDPRDDLADVPRVAPYVRPSNWGLTEQQRLESMQAYYASITFMDAQLGRILDALDRLKLADNTIVVFWSDHGYILGRHGQWMKMSLFEESARVPLVIRAPGVTSGKATKRTVELLDLYPTLAELCGLEAPPDLHGQSLRPLLDNPAAEWTKPAYTQVTRTHEKRRIMGYSVRTENYRYTEWDDAKLGAELYDHKTDPAEYANVADDALYAPIRAEMRQLLMKIDPKPATQAATRPATRPFPRTMPAR
jgi:uncharacterized sulfatase